MSVQRVRVRVVCGITPRRVPVLVATGQSRGKDRKASVSGFCYSVPTEEIRSAYSALTGRFCFGENIVVCMFIYVHVCASVRVCVGVD